MDFGTVGVDGLVVGTSSSSSAFLDGEAKQRQYGSGIFKTDRSSVSDDEWRNPKLAKTDDFSLSKAMQRGIVLPSMIRSNNSSSSSSSSLFSAAARQEQQQQMLCFSSPKTESALPYYNYPVSASAPCSNYSGFSLGSLNLQGGGGSCKGGGFTPSQWMELEQQALIYKYINANIPVPSNLLIPIKKAFESAGFSFYHGGSIMRPNTNSLGWGGFHLGFSGSSDPEPGRCRRTDGKKWRCSKDAMPDQKYCERHMNRGRHRSRKPVEGQSAHPLSGTAAAAKESSTTLLPPVASSAPAAAVGGAAYNTSAAYQMQPGVLSLSADNTLNRFLVSKDNSTAKPQNPTATFSNDIIKPTDNPFLMMKYDNNNESSRGSSCRFGSDTLFGNLGTLKELTDRETTSPHHHHFMNSDWTQPQSHVSNNHQSDSTHLSISMMSHNSDHPILPLNLGMGGPLGEVLQNANSSTSSSTTECKNSSSGLNLMMDGWERSSPAGSYSSPTAVLQKSSAFESVSNSSAGSSPRAA